MISIDRKEFFTILQGINKECTQSLIRNKFFDEIEKFNNLLDFINLNDYSFDYIQNRFFAIKWRNTDFNNIERIIICPFDTKYNVEVDSCENIVYDFGYKSRNSYLTKPINPTSESPDTNERDCIKGSMNPGLLDAIIVYLIKHNMIKENTLVIFSLKSNDTQWHGDDILEYLQERVNHFDCKIHSLIDLRYCSNPKGKPEKDFTGKLNIKVQMNDNVLPYIKNLTRLEEKDFQNNLNYNLRIERYSQPKNKINGFNYERLKRNYKINLNFQPRLFIFTDLKPTNKFSTFFFDKEFLVQWKSIENYINILLEIINT